MAYKLDKQTNGLLCYSWNKQGLIDVV